MNSWRATTANHLARYSDNVRILRQRNSCLPVALVDEDFYHLCSHKNLPWKHKAVFAWLRRERKVVMFGFQDLSTVIFIQVCCYLMNVSMTAPLCLFGLYAFTAETGIC